MLTTSRSLTINAAFLQEVKDDNIHLRELLVAASAVLNPKSQVDIKPRALAELFQQIRDQLATHFMLEETLGYVDDAIGAAPRLSQRARELRDEHESLSVEVADLVTAARRLLADRGEKDAVPLLLIRFRDFCQQLKRHEDAENELIMEAIYDELGVGD